jgi:hypothetical protein
MNPLEGVQLLCYVVPLPLVRLTLQGRPEAEIDANNPQGNSHPPRFVRAPNSKIASTASVVPSVACKSC